MKNLIYQYYDGPVLPGTKASVSMMKEYANRIGAEHLFEENPRWIVKKGRNLGRYTPHYGQFKIVYDPFFEQYDSVLFLDSDIFPVDKLQENIFEVPVGHLGICTEGLQPDIRKRIGGQINHAADEKFARMIKEVYKKDLPRREDGLLKVYNSGVVLYTKDGRQHCKKNFIKFENFKRQVFRYGISDFYASDQGYIHAMLEVANLDWVELNAGWNSFIHYEPETSGPKRPVVDTRTEETKFVHVQLRAADHYDYDKLWRITNQEESTWGIYE